MLQQVAVIYRTQAEVLEPVREGVVDVVVQLAGVRRYEGGGLVTDQAELVAKGDRLRERMDVMAGHLLADGGVQEACRQPGVLGLLANQGCCGVDREGVQFPGGGTVVQAADGLAGHTHGVDAIEAIAVQLHRADDLVHVNSFVTTAALLDTHAGFGG